MNVLHAVARRGERSAKHLVCSLVGLVGLSLIAASAHGMNLVVDSNAGSDERGALFNVDPSNGNRALVSDFGNASQGPLGMNPVAIIVDADGAALVADLDAGTDSHGALFKINLANGRRTLISDFGDSSKGPLGEDPVNLTLGASEQIFVVDLAAGINFDGAVFRINPANGDRTLISSFGNSVQGPTAEIPLGIATDASGQLLVTVLAAGAASTSALFSIDPSSGTRTLLSDFGSAAQGPLGEIPFGVMVAPTGEILVVDEDVGPDFRGGIFKINGATGSRKLISDFGDSAQGPLGEDPVNLALMASKEILVIDFTAGSNLLGSLFKVNPVNGNRVLLSDFGDASEGPLGKSPFGIALVPEQKTSGSLQFSAADYGVTENGGNARIAVTRTGGSDGAVSVGYTTTTGGTATEGADYSYSQGTLSFADGETRAKTFSIPIIDDGDSEDNETIELSLVNPDGGATLSAPNTAVLTITDNDRIEPKPSTLQFSAANHSVAENGGSAKITVTRSGDRNTPVSVSYNVTGGSAVEGKDFTIANKLGFGAGYTGVRTLSVSIIDDTVVEGDETINLSLTNPTGGAILGTPGMTAVTIADNDKPTTAASCRGRKVTIVGTAKSDTIQGTSRPDVIEGFTGNDIIRGRGGADVICGGLGQDQLFGDAQNDELFGGGGSDKLNGGSGFDRCEGGAGRDRAILCERRTSIP